MRKKKIFSLILAFMLIFTACANDKASPEKSEEKVTTQEVTTKGHNGDVKFRVSFEGQKIKDIEILEHKETENLGDVALEKIREEIISTQSIAIDTVAGATISSKAIIDSVKEAIKLQGLDETIFNKTVENNKKTEKKEITTDVVVIGGGGAGFAAAITAKENGANVVLLEKLATVGGNTLISGGEYAAPGNEIQKKENIEDSPELFSQDVQKAGGNKELIDVLSNNALDGANWLKEKVGVEWLDSLMFFGGHSVKRSLIPKGHSGTEIIGKYLNKAKELGVEVLTEHNVTEIISENGKISGVIAQTPNGETIVHAKSVVIASGGFGANDEMTNKFDKEIDDKILSTNSPGATGDGIIMAEKLGANTVGMESIQLYPICDVDTGKLLYVGDTRLVGGALLVNKEGKRFVEELGTRREISLAIKSQTGNVGYLIWDEVSSEKTGTIVSHADEAKSLYDRGLLVKADTIEELAEHFGLNKEELLKTVENFNKNSKNNQDPEFNLRMLGWTIEKAPFYMLKALPAVHHTMGGIEINTNSEVLNKEGKVIPGLFAAGEVTGGIHGKNRLGSAALADITVFGRIAGENAAKFAK